MLFSACTSNPYFDENRVKSYEEAVSINYNISFVAPWSNYIEQLLPNYTYTYNDALSDVLPKTMNYTDLKTNAISSQIKFSLPTVTKEYSGY